MRKRIIIIVVVVVSVGLIAAGILLAPKLLDSIFGGQSNPSTPPYDDPDIVITGQIPVSPDLPFDTGSDSPEDVDPPVSSGELLDPDATPSGEDSLGQEGDSLTTEDPDPVDSGEIVSPSPGPSSSPSPSGEATENPIGTSSTVYTWVDIPTSELVLAEKLTRPTMYGRLVIQSMGISVPLYYNSAQSTVNAVDSAAIFDYGGSRLIADQWEQGFSAIKDMKAGITAHIVLPEGIETYTCSNVGVGQISSNLIVNSAGTSLANLNPEGFHLYSSDGTSDTKVWIASFTFKSSTVPGEDQSGSVSSPAPSNTPSSSGSSSGGSGIYIDPETGEIRIDFSGIWDGTWNGTWENDGEGLGDDDGELGGEPSPSPTMSPEEIETSGAGYLFTLPI